MGVTRQERLDDPDMNGGPITVGSLTFTTGLDCFNEPKWYAGGQNGWVVGKFRENQWWSRRIYDTEGIRGVTATSREEAMKNCLAGHAAVSRQALWEQYMRDNDPPTGELK